MVRRRRGKVDELRAGKLSFVSRKLKLGSKWHITEALKWRELYWLPSSNPPRLLRHRFLGNFSFLFLLFRAVPPGGATEPRLSGIPPEIGLDSSSTAEERFKCNISIDMYLFFTWSFTDVRFVAHVPALSRGHVPSAITLNNLNWFREFCEVPLASSSLSFDADIILLLFRLDRRTPSRNLRRTFSSWLLARANGLQRMPFSNFMLVEHPPTSSAPSDSPPLRSRVAWIIANAWTANVASTWGNDTYYLCAIYNNKWFSQQFWFAVVGISLNCYPIPLRSKDLLLVHFIRGPVS